MEANMQVLEGAQYRMRVKLTNEAGEQLPPELFRVYAGAFCPGYAPVHFHAERTAEEWVLTMPGLKPGRVPWNWQVIAAEYATGVEWILAAGEVRVTPRHATGSGYVDPGELKIVATLDKTTLQMTVQVGESTSACSLAVVDARNSAKAAAYSAEHAAEQAQAAETARTHAAGSATKAAVSADDAHGQATSADTSAQQAANSASNAAASAELASEHAAEAAGSATDADTSSKAAADSASDAIQASENAATAAAAAEADRVTCADQAARAEGYAQQAALENAHATQAAAAAAVSQSAAEAAQAEAEAQATRAEAAADLLGEAALQGQNNTFEAGTTQTVNGIAVFNGDMVLNGECSGAAIDKQKAMAALQDLQGYKQSVFYHRGYTSTSGIVKQVQPEIFSCAAKKDGEKVGAYYAESKDYSSTYACMLLRYDKTSPVEIIMNFSRDALAYPSRGNNLYAKAWGEAGNSVGCFSSLFIEGTHVYLKQSHSITSGHYSFSVYDLGVSEVLKKTNKLVWYLGDGFSRKIKMCVWGLVGDELQLVAVFNTGTAYSMATRLWFTLWGKATNVYAVRDETPELNNMVTEKNKAVTNKDFQLVNNDVAANNIQTVEAAGGELVVTFAEAAGCGWTVERLPEWVTAEVTECENGGQIVLTIAPNESGSARTDYMLFKSIGDHAHGYPCTVCNEIKQNA